MQKQTTYKELYDPFSHYVRGVLWRDEEKFTFTAYRTPYLVLNEKTWRTEKAFDADYRKLVERKYSYLDF